MDGQRIEIQHLAQWSVVMLEFPERTELWVWFQTARQNIQIFASLGKIQLFTAGQLLNAFLVVAFASTSLKYPRSNKFIRKI